MPKRSATSFAELGGLRDALKAEAERRAAEDKRRREEAERLAREARVFQDAMGDVKPLRADGRLDPLAPAAVQGRPAPVAVQFERDERRALAESLSDAIDLERLLDTDESLSYRRAGIGPDVLRRLRRGEWVIQRQLDLHGLVVDEAREATAAFLVECMRTQTRCVRIVHGKGLGSRNREPVLRDKVRRWLVQRDEVLAFCQARPSDGGAGATVVLLRAG